MKVCDALKPVKFEDNNVIIKKGDKADKMYIVEDGEVKVFRTVSKTHSNTLPIYTVESCDFIALREGRSGRVVEIQLIWWSIELRIIF